MLIVLSGKAGSGKTVVENALKEVLLYRNVRYYSRAYADELKEFLMREVGLTYEQVYGSLKEVPDKRYPKVCDIQHKQTYWTPRDFLQYFGTDVFRNINPLFWVKKLQKYVEDHGSNCIIPDARFINEIDWVKNSNGLHLDIQRSICGAKQGKNHLSETSLDNVSNDYTIMNNHDNIEDLTLYLRSEILPIILNKINGE